jgi:hypothetical protein
VAILLLIYTHQNRIQFHLWFIYKGHVVKKFVFQQNLQKNSFPSSFTCITFGKISANTSAKFKLLTWGKSFLLKKKNSV